MPTTAHRFDDVTLHGDGFVLRAPCAEDVGPIAAACRDDLIQRWLPLPTPYEEADARFFVDEFASSQLTGGDGIVRTIEADGELAGMIDLKHTDWRGRTTEIGYWIAPGHRGAGLAGRATEVLADWALREQGMARVEVRAAVGNAASSRAALAAGFTHEGCLRSAGYVHDGRVDLEVYGRIAGDLNAPRAAGTGC